MNDSVTKKVAVAPYYSGLNDHEIIKLGFISAKFDIVDYKYMKYKKMSFSDVSFLYLNWIENTLDEEDVAIFNYAKKKGIRIIWTFHNKVQHNSDNKEESLRNISYMIHISDTIIIHVTRR